MQLSNSAIKEELFSKADEKYKAFHSKLIPENIPLIGVRMPLLKKLAKDIAKEPASRSWLANAASDYYEERVLQGLVIGFLKTDSKEQLTLIERFLPLIDNWAVCDSFCANLKSYKKLQSKGFSLLLKYLKNKKPYTQRFAIVMLLNHYTESEHTAAALSAFEKINTNEYYVEMAIAWAVSVYFVKQRNLTLDWLRHCQLNDFTYNKALQKICESYRVSTEDKVIIKAMKRH